MEAFGGGQEYALVDDGNYPKICATGYEMQFMPCRYRTRFLLWDWFKTEGVWRRHVTGSVTRFTPDLQEEYRLFGKQIADALGGCAALQATH